MVDYINSCSQCALVFGALDCFCSVNGNVKQSTLVNACQCTWVSNINGQLTCMNGGTPTFPTFPAFPTFPTIPPSGNVQQCVWSATIMSNGGVENTPRDLCSQKANANGCMQNNFCCYNPQNGRCQPVPTCPECPAFGADANTCNRYSGCCQFVNGWCQRKCPFGGTNTQVCAPISG